MYHCYEYQVICRLPGGTKYPYRGRLNNLRSESEAIAYLRSHYSNIISIDVWEV